jgi:hypothetical protein
MIIAQIADLKQDGVVTSLSFYVSNAAGLLRLGIYDATGTGGGPGNLVAETEEIVPEVGWNNTYTVSEVNLTSGTYWLAYIVSDNDLHFRSSGPVAQMVYDQFGYDALPSVFPLTPSTGLDQWSFYANMFLEGI